MRVIVAELPLHVAAKPEQPRADVALELSTSEQFGDSAGRLSPPDLELEQAVASGGVPLSEKEIVLVLRVDVRDAGVIADDLDGCSKRGDRERLGGRLKKSEEEGQHGAERTAAAEALQTLRA